MDKIASDIPDREVDLDSCGLWPPVLTLFRPICQTSAVILSSPHSGRDYPAHFLAESRLDPIILRKSEDSFVEELYGAAPEYGVPLIAARFPRVYCDANREKWELDPTMFEDRLPEYVNRLSPRVAAGLGTIARLVAPGEPIYRRKLRFADVQARIDRCWQPYHDTLATLIAETHRRFGACLVLDVHSMPSPATHGRGPGPDIVLGDAHGAACSGPIMQFIEASLRREGFVVQRNDPYAGGYVTRHYGRPRERVHVVQIEIAKPLYMDEQTVMRGSNFSIIQASLERLIGAVAQNMMAMV